MSTTLCDILKSFSRTAASEVMPCASFELKLAVNRARMGGLLARDGKGFVLTESGAQTLTDCRRRKLPTKKGSKK